TGVLPCRFRKEVPGIGGWRVASLGEKASAGSYPNTLDRSRAMEKRKPLRLSGLDISLGAEPGQRTHPSDEAGAFSDAQCAARIEHIEEMRCFHTTIVGRQHQAFCCEGLALRLIGRKRASERRDVRALKVVLGKLDLVLVMKIAVGHTLRPDEVIHVFHALKIHGDPFFAVGA